MAAKAVGTRSVQTILRARRTDKGRDLGAVAVGSFAVHVAVVTNTSWVGDFLHGQPLGTGDAQAALTLTPEMDTAKAGYVIDQPTGSQVTVILQDGTVTQGILQSDLVLTSSVAEAPPLVIDQ